MEKAPERSLRQSLILDDSKEKITESPAAAEDSSTPDSDSAVCWVCLDESKEEPLLSDLCFCTHRQVHKSCLEKWYHYSSERRNGMPPSCPACKGIYRIELHSDTPTGHAEAEITGITLEDAQIDSYTFQQCVTLPWRVIILLIGICAGVICKSFADEQDILFQNIQIWTACVYNAVIAIFWIFASSEDQPERVFTIRVFHLDGLLLCVTYLCFLFGCALATAVSKVFPNNRDKNIALPVHTINFFCCLILLGTRRVFVVGG